MDEDETQRVDGPTPALSPLPPAPPALPPAPPPPMAADAARDSSGWPMPVTSAGTGPASPALDLGRIVGRTFDTLGREWSLFLALAVPAGIGGFLSAALSQSFQEILRDPASASANQVGLLLAQVVVALLSGVSTLATVIATDSLWRGRPIGLGEAFAGALRLVPRAIGLLLLGLLLLLGFTVALIGSLLLIGVLGSGGAFIGILGALALFALLVYASARLSLLLPVLALEPIAVREVIGRTWRLTRGNVLMLFAITIVIGILGLFPAWGGTMFSLFVENRTVAGIALALATMVTAPLAGIWTVLAWATLTRAPYTDSEVMRTGRGRAIGFLVVVGVGLVLMVVGGGLAGAGAERLLELTPAI